MSKRSGGKREQIMRAAAMLFADRRYHELTLDMVAKKAKVGKGTLYLYFKGKDDLFRQTTGWGFEQLCESLLKAKIARGGLKKVLLSACRQLGEWRHKQWQLMQMMQAEERHKVWSKKGVWQGWMEAKKRLIDILVDMMISGGKGELRRDVKPRVLAALLLEMSEANSPVLWEMEREKRYKLVVDVFCHGAGKKK